MKQLYTIPEKCKIRVIIDSDAKNEADDQFAIVHALLTPQFDVRGIVASHFGTYRTQQSMEESYQECLKLLDLMKLDQDIPVFRSAKAAMQSRQEYEYSEGAQKIVEEALKDEQSKLFVVVLGPLTNVAAAYLQHPEIAGKFTCIWIGGGKYPEGNVEFNLMNDVKAANVVMQSDIELWQVPCNVYSMMKVSFAELKEEIYTCGELGKYLFDQLVEFRDFAVEAFERWDNVECWCLGDSPVVGLMMNPHEYAYTMRTAPLINEQMHYEEQDNARKIRVYESIDSHFILKDMYAKIHMHYGVNV